VIGPLEKPKLVEATIAGLTALMTANGATAVLSDPVSHSDAVRQP